MPYADPQKQRERPARWLARNPERARELQRRWRARNPERVRELNRRSRARNPKRVRELAREQKQRWCARNPERVREKSRLRRARKRNQLGVVSTDVEKLLFEIQRGLCFHCDRLLSEGAVHLDHLRPLVMGGLHDDGNVALSCAKCNMSRGGRVDAGVGPLALHLLN